MRRKLAATIALALLLGVTAAQEGLPTGAVQEPPMSYTDLDEAHWAADAITRLTALGVVTGYPNGTFGGTRAATRYELAVVAARLLDLLSTSISDLISDPDFQRAIQDAAENNARLVRIEQLMQDAAAVDYVTDLAERLANVEEYLNEQAGEQLFPGLAALEEDRPVAVTDRGPLNDEEVARIVDELEQQIERSRALALAPAYFGVQAGYPLAGGVHFGMRDLFTDNLGARLSVGYSQPPALGMELAVLYGFPAALGRPDLTLYAGGGVLMRIGSGTADLGLELLIGTEYSLPRGPVSLFAELGPAFSVAPTAGDASLVLRLGMNYGLN